MGNKLQSKKKKNEGIPVQETKLVKRLQSTDLFKIYCRKKAAKKGEK